MPQRRRPPKQLKYLSHLSWYAMTEGGPVTLVSGSVRPDVKEIW